MRNAHVRRRKVFRVWARRRRVWLPLKAPNREDTARPRAWQLRAVSIDDDVIAAAVVNLQLTLPEPDVLKQASARPVTSMCRPENDARYASTARPSAETFSFYSGSTFFEISSIQRNEALSSV
jgi:hypothetical protein